jgi:hypothetical protein
MNLTSGPTIATVLLAFNCVSRFLMDGSGMFLRTALRIRIRIDFCRLDQVTHWECGSEPRSANFRQR